MKNIENVINKYSDDLTRENNNTDNSKNPGRLGVPHYSLDGHLRNRDYIESLDIYKSKLTVVKTEDDILRIYEDVKRVIREIE